MGYFVVDMDLTPDLDLRAEVRPRHRAYLSDLLAAGKLRESGPYADQTGALFVYIADSADEARQLVAGDPYSHAGLVAGYRVREWTKVFGPADQG